MGTIGNNTSRELQLLRDEFFTEDKVKEFEKLMEFRENKVLYNILLNKNAKALYNKAMELSKDIELGKINPEEIESVKSFIILCYAAIVDLYRELLLEKVFEKCDFASPDGSEMGM